MHKEDEDYDERDIPRALMENHEIKKAGQLKKKDTQVAASRKTYMKEYLQKRRAKMELQKEDPKTKAKLADIRKQDRVRSALARSKKITKAYV